MGGAYDAVMDRYAYILEQLQRNDCRKLRGYVADPRARFTTWLVVVCRRLALDHHRQKYGRVRPGTDVIRLQARRDLAQTLAFELDLEAIAGPALEQPDAIAERHELEERLHAGIAGLPAADRLLLKLRFEDDMSAAQIARFLRAPTPFHIYRRLNHVLGRLRDAFTAPSEQKQSARPLNVK